MGQLFSLGPGPAEPPPSGLKGHSGWVGLECPVPGSVLSVAGLREGRGGGGKARVAEAEPNWEP